MQSRPPRVRRRDPALIESLLSRRDADGTSIARLSQESGIPFGTLSYWSWRRRQRPVQHGRAFAEVVVRTDASSSPVVQVGQPMFELALTNGRRVTVGAGFDADELRRLLAIAEAGAC